MKRILTFLVALVSALLPLSPLVEAWSLAAAPACQCCAKAGEKCCRREHKARSGGPAWSASPGCGSACSLPGSTAPSAPLFSAVPASAGAPLFAPVIDAAFLPAPPRPSVSPFAWLYQRPPPPA
ncbi:MAG: hypothetical protein ABUS49_07300 [Acidobacteriota bacterium]